MICPHCKENLLYKERGGKECSKCKREFAFEPKIDPLGLHDAKFQKAVEKLSDGGKLYFTPQQMYYLLGRKKIINSNSKPAGAMIFIAILSLVASFIISFSSGFYIFLFLGLVVTITAVLFAVIIWNREGDLTLPAIFMEREVFNRWSYIYKNLPPQLITKPSTALQSGVLTEVRGVLICPEEEVLACLAANRTNELLGLMLFNPTHLTDEANKSKLDFIRQKRDLPVFVLHDASAEGCQIKQKFVAKYLGNDQKRPVFDIGLRPRTVMNTPLLKLRLKEKNPSPPQFSNINAEEAAWLNAGNYTPLLALTPAQLIRYVSSAVQKQLQHVPAPQIDEQKEAQNVGFMTWVGQTR